MPKSAKIVLLEPITESLKHYRSQMNPPLTQKEVAQAVSVLLNKKFSEFAYQHIEAGRNKANLEIATALARVLQTDLSMLFYVPDDEEKELA